MVELTGLKYNTCTKQVTRKTFLLSMLHIKCLPTWHIILIIVSFITTGCWPSPPIIFIVHRGWRSTQRESSLSCYCKLFCHCPAIPGSHSKYILLAFAAINRNIFLVFAIAFFFLCVKHSDSSLLVFALASVLVQPISVAFSRRFLFVWNTMKYGCIANTKTKNVNYHFTQGVCIYGNYRNWYCRSSVPAMMSLALTSCPTDL